MRRRSIVLGKDTRVAEDLGQAVDYCVDVVTELADEVGVGLEMANEPSRGCGVMVEVLEAGSIEGEFHPQHCSSQRHPIGTRLTSVGC